MLRAFSITTAVRVFRLLVGLGISFLLGRYLGTQGFGQISISMAIVNTLICIGELGLGRYTVRELLVSPDGEAATLGTTIGMRLRVGVILFGLLCAYLAIVAPAGWFLVLIYGMQILTSPFTELLSWFEARSMAERVALSSLVGFAVSTACIIIGVWLAMPLWYFAATYVLECWCSLAVAAASFWRLGGRVRFGHYSPVRALELFGRSWFELISQLALLLLFRVDAIMVGALRGESEAGIYSAAVRVSETVYFIPSAIGSACIARLISLKQNGAASYQQRVIEYFSLSLIIAIIGASSLAVASPALPLLFGQSFTASSAVLVVHAWAFIPYCIGFARTQYLIVEDRLAVNLPCVLVALAVNVGLNWLWIPPYGAHGAAWATLVAYTIAWVASSFVLPGARDIGKLILRSITAIPAVVMQAQQRLSQAIARA
jgi:O-antigen/teichoic acid export membrane protein